MKTALVLSGGGAKGAFQAGALQVLAEHGIKYQSIAGVSVGALNGVMVAANKLARLTQIWETITQDQVYTKRSLPWLALQYLGHKIGIAQPPQSIYSNDPLYELLKAELSNITLEVPLSVGRVNLQTGDYIHAINPSAPYFLEIILASTAIPVIWKPVDIEGNLFVDGGIRNTTPLKDAIRTNPDRIIVITNGPLDAFATNPTINDIVDIAERSLDIMLDEIFREDLKRCQQINRLVQQAEEKGVTLYSKNGRRLQHYEIITIAPPEPLGSALDFGRKRLDQLLEKGREEAKKVLQNRL